MNGLREQRRSRLCNDYRVSTNIPDRFLGSPSFDELLRWLEEYGFSRPEIGRIVGRHPQALQYTIERTSTVLANLEMQALFRSEVIAMATKFPALIGATPDRTNCPRGA